MISKADSCADDGPYSFGARCASAMALLDFLQLRSALALRSFCRLGAAISGHGLGRLGASMAVLDIGFLGSALAMRSFACSGASVCGRGSSTSSRKARAGICSGGSLRTQTGRSSNGSPAISFTGPGVRSGCTMTSCLCSRACRRASGTRWTWCPSTSPSGVPKRVLILRASRLWNCSRTMTDRRGPHPKIPRPPHPRNGEGRQGVSSCQPAPLDEGAARLPGSWRVFLALVEGAAVKPAPHRRSPFLSEE